MTERRRLRIAFIHPDLGIGGAERLVVDATLGLQQLGHSVDLYTSHHDSTHCFDETRDGSLNVHYIKPPLPRSIGGKFHILFAHLRQLHLTTHLLLTTKKYDVYFVDQLATCVPFLRGLGRTPVVFYCHFPDKLLANGAFVEGELSKRKNVSFLKKMYRMPMDWLEEVTTRQADILLANSAFTARVFKTYFPSISRLPRVVYPGINLSAYESPTDSNGSDVLAVVSSRHTLLSLNRFEKKKDIMLALRAFSILINQREDLRDLRLVLGGGYDPRLEDNIQTLSELVSAANALRLTCRIISPNEIPTSAARLIPDDAHAPSDPQVLFLLNFTTAQRSALLLSPSTLVLLYTPQNEHFGIVPIEAMACGLPVLACNSGGPTESVIASPPSERTGWLEEPDPTIWANVLVEIVSSSISDPTGREALSERAKRRAIEGFGSMAMARGLEDALWEAASMGRVAPGSVAMVLLVIVGIIFGYVLGGFL